MTTVTWNHSVLYTRYKEEMGGNENNR